MATVAVIAEEPTRAALKEAADTRLVATGIAVEVPDITEVASDITGVASDITGVASDITGAAASIAAVIVNIVGAVVRIIAEFADFRIAMEHVAIIEVERIAATAVAGTPGMIGFRPVLALVEARSP